MKKKLLAGMFAASMLIGNFLFTSTVEAEIQTYVGTGEYIMSDYETPVIAKERARARALTNAQEQAGVYVERHLKVNNHRVNSDVINVITKGIVNVIGDVKYTQTPIDEGGGSYQIIATVRVNIDSDDIDKWFAKDEQERETLIEQNKELQRSNVEKDKEIEQLKRQIASVKTEAEQARLTAQFEKADKEFLSNQKVKEGYMYYYAGKYSESMNAYNEAIELNPKNAEAYNNRGYVYHARKQYEQAIVDYTKAIQLNPSYAIAYQNCGYAYDDLQQYSRGIADYTKAIQLFPQYSLAYNNRGYAYKKLKQYEQAIADYTRAIEISPMSVAPYNNRGAAYNALNKYHQAIIDFNKAINIAPNFALTYYNRAFSYNRLEQYDLAILDLNKVIELVPNFAGAYYGRGCSYNALGDTARAEADFAKARELGYNG